MNIGIARLKMTDLSLSMLRNESETDAASNAAIMIIGPSTRAIFDQCFFTDVSHWPVLYRFCGSENALYAGLMLKKHKLV